MSASESHALHPLTSLRPARLHTSRPAVVCEEKEEGVLVSHTSSFRSPAVPMSAPNLVATSEGDEKVDLKGMLLAAGLESPTRSLLTQGKVYRIPVGVAVNISTNGSGLVNAVVSVSGNLVVLARFNALATIFDEFFVSRIHSRYVPYNKYQITVGTTGSNRTSVPMHSASLQHDATPYSAPSDMLVNPTWQVHDTVTDALHVWRNVESPKVGIAASPDQGSPRRTQSWCLTVPSAAALYTGQIQYLGPVGVTMANSTIFGTLSVVFDVLWRCRR